MLEEKFNRMSDFEIHKQLTQIGLPAMPVTETTRPILIKKLIKHIKDQNLKKGKVKNYVLYSKDNQTSPSAYYLHNTNLSEQFPENNNDSNDYTNSSTIYKVDTVLNRMHNSASMMYSPPPVLASNYEIDNEHHTSYNNHRTAHPISCDVPASYGKINGKTNTCDGGVVNRLLSFRDTTIKKKMNSKVSVATSKAMINNGIIRKCFTFNYKLLFKKPDNSIIPHILIASLLIFLAMISVLYAAKKFELSPIFRTDPIYTICNPNDKDLQFSSQKIMCISEDLFNKAMYISEELFKNLNERARLHHCINQKHSPTLEISELKSALSVASNDVKDNLQKKLLATQYLISQNPQWMIKTIVSSVNSSDQVLSFELMEPKLPLKCIIIKKITRFFTVIGLLVLITFSGLLIYFLSAVFRIRQKEKSLATEQFIKDIINELIYQSSHSENSELIINQLQEKFLPVNKRSKLLHSWNKALKMLEENDSRVLFGIIERNGEQLRTVTWNKNTCGKEISTTKKWQSSAFDNTNKIVNPPTSCLKIRHMFDQTEIDQPNLRKMIVESIYEKVGSNCKICDIQLDTQTCCVYIRCATEADAGMVHNEINGWWFDKKLISIKFLRLERYLSRFPKSSADPIYFKSSNVN
ncbi:hypothetical protein KR222_009158 [Zaprionus bogoriensis]|nr:hypothetical protein KR222_009158 [Zaprionus bogoriensis]